MNTLLQRPIAATLFVAQMSPSLSASGQDSPVFTLENTDQVVQLFELDEHEAAIYTTAWSPDGTQLVTGSGEYQGDTTLCVWGLP